MPYISWIIFPPFRIYNTTPSANKRDSDIYNVEARQTEIAEAIWTGTHVIHISFVIQLTATHSNYFQLDTILTCIIRIYRIKIIRFTPGRKLPLNSLKELDFISRRGCAFWWFHQIAVTYSCMPTQNYRL